jgi:beta-fructofuranosidase
LLDYGPNFYAPNTMLLRDGSRLVWGWVNGFSSGHGWNGCLSLPRSLSVTGDGQLRQIPAPQLAKLRGSPVVWRNLHLQNREETLPLPRTNTLEILADIHLDGARALALEFRAEVKGMKPIAIGFDREQLSVDGANAPLPSSSDRAGKLELRIFVDRSVLEVVANKTVWITKTIPPPDPNSSLTVRSDGGVATLRLVKAWPIKTIW